MPLSFLVYGTIVFPDPQYRNFVISLLVHYSTIHRKCNDHLVPGMLNAEDMDEGVSSWLHFPFLPPHFSVFKFEQTYHVFKDLEAHLIVLLIRVHHKTLHFISHKRKWANCIDSLHFFISWITLGSRHLVKGNLFKIFQRHKS